MFKLLQILVLIIGLGLITHTSAVAMGKGKGSEVVPGSGKGKGTGKSKISVSLTPAPTPTIAATTVTVPIIVSSPPPQTTSSSPSSSTSPPSGTTTSTTTSADDKHGDEVQLDQFGGLTPQQFVNQGSGAGLVVLQSDEEYVKVKEARNNNNKLPSINVMNDSKLEYEYTQCHPAVDDNENLYGSNQTSCTTLSSNSSLSYDYIVPTISLSKPIVTPTPTNTPSSTPHEEYYEPNINEYSLPQPY
eukprot:Pgem_evm1s6046